MTVVLPRDDDDKAVDRQVARPSVLVRHILLLVLARRPSHGYDLARALGDWRPGSISQVYRLLRQMEDAGLAHAEWGPTVGGPGRRTYSLTTRGEEVVRECTASLEDLDVILAGYLARHEALGRRQRASGPTGDL